MDRWMDDLKTIWKFKIGELVRLTSLAFRGVSAFFCMGVDGASGPVSCLYPLPASMQVPRYGIQIQRWHQGTSNIAHSKGLELRRKIDVLCLMK